MALNARKNAQEYFDQRRKAVQKHEKTGAAAVKAIKGAERKAAAEIVKVKEVSAAKVERQALWFEKFCWFITSENFLVLSGHDAQQNEILVKRYLRKGDLYVTLVPPQCIIVTLTHVRARGCARRSVDNHQIQRCWYSYPATLDC